MPSRDHQRQANHATQNLVTEIKFQGRNPNTLPEIELSTINHQTWRALTGTLLMPFRNVISCKSIPRKNRGKFHLRKSSENLHKRRSQWRLSRSYHKILSKARRSKRACSWSPYPMMSQRTQLGRLMGVVIINSSKLSSSIEIQI